MSIQLIARELYRVQRQVQQLEAELEAAPVAAQEAIREKLRQARAELRNMKNILEGAKAEPVCRQPGSPFRKKI